MPKDGNDRVVRGVIGAVVVGAWVAVLLVRLDLFGLVTGGIIVVVAIIAGVGAVFVQDWWDDRRRDQPVAERGQGGGR
jgi:hypothetical protein